MNQNKGGIRTKQTLAETCAREGESFWIVLLIALAIIGTMYIYDRTWAQPAGQRSSAEIACNPPPSVVTDAETFKHRS